MPWDVVLLRIVSRLVPAIASGLGTLSHILICHSLVANPKLSCFIDSYVIQSLSYVTFAMASNLGSDLSSIRAVKPIGPITLDEDDIIASLPVRDGLDDVPSPSDLKVSDAFEIMLAQVRTQYLIEMSETLNCTLIKNL